MRGQEALYPMVEFMGFCHDRMIGGLSSLQDQTTPELAQSATVYPNQAGAGRFGYGQDAGIRRPAA